MLTRSLAAVGVIFVIGFFGCDESGQVQLTGDLVTEVQSVTFDGDHAEVVGRVISQADDVLGLQSCGSSPIIDVEVMESGEWRELRLVTCYMAAVASVEMNPSDTIPVSVRFDRSKLRGVEEVRIVPGVVGNAGDAATISKVSFGL